jgi:hypothetical protein
MIVAPCLKVHRRELNPSVGNRATKALGPLSRSRNIHNRILHGAPKYEPPTRTAPRVGRLLIIPRKDGHFTCKDPYQGDYLKHSGLALAVGLV